MLAEMCMMEKVVHYSATMPAAAAAVRVCPQVEDVMRLMQSCNAALQPALPSR
jgi:hypothetical protein